MDAVAHTCAHCGRATPYDGRELAAWEAGELALADQLDDVTAMMLVCPICRRELSDTDYEAAAQA